MFNRIVSGSGARRYLSSDNDPLFLFRQWGANLRILDVIFSTNRADQSFDKWRFDPFNADFSSKSLLGSVTLPLDQPVYMWTCVSKVDWEG